MAQTRAATAAASDRTGQAADRQHQSRRGLERRSILLGASAWMLAGCAVRVRRVEPQPTIPVQPDPADLVPRVPPEAAYAAVAAQRAILVDVRSAESFQARHAAGALLLPIDDIERSPQTALARLPTNKQPILYCT